MSSESNDLLLILDPPRVRSRNLKQFYQVWKSDAARYRALVAGPPIVHPLPPDAPFNQGKRTASAAFDEEDDSKSDAGPERTLKRRTSSGWDLGGAAVRSLVHTAANVYRSLVPSNWPMASQSGSASETKTPTWEYQTVGRSAILIASGTQVPPEEQKILPPPLAAPLNALSEDAVDSPDSRSTVAQASEIVFFPDGALPSDTDLDGMNAILRSLSEDSSPPPMFAKSLASGNDFLYATKVRLWPPDSDEYDDLLPWTYLDYALVIDTCEALLWFLAYDFSKLSNETGPDETDGVTVVGFTESQDGSSFKYRKVLPEAPLERVEGKAHVVSSDGASLLLRRWNDALKVPVVPRTWKWKQSDEQSDEERMTLPRVLAYAVDSKTAAQPFDGRLGFAVPGYKGPWEDESLGAEAHDQVTFWDALCHKVPQEESHLQFTMRLLFPLPRYDALAYDKAQSFIYFGKETPCVLRHDGNEYHPIFGPTIPVIPNTRVQGRFDLWTVRLLAVTLLVPPSDDSPTWMPIRIDMPNNGVRAILDTASMNSTFSPTTIKSMCDRWFTVGDSDVEQTEQAHADRERFFDHDLLFTFEGTDGSPVDFRCDAAWFFCRLWEDKESRELFRWSHVRSSNDDESDIVVLGMNFFWGAFVKFSAPYEGSDTVPSIQFAAQRAVVEGQKIHGPWDFTFAK